MNGEIKDCVMTEWRCANVKMKDWRMMTESNSVEDGGLFDDREWFLWYDCEIWLWHACVQTGDRCWETAIHALCIDQWFLWCDCDTCIAHRPVVIVVWLWHMHCLQTTDSCGVTVTHALFTDHRFLWCDCDTRIVYRLPILVVWLCIFVGIGFTEGFRYMRRVLKYAFAYDGV